MNKERIANLIAAGMTDAQIATVVGISPSRLSQIRKEEDFILLLQSKQAELSIKDVEEISLSAKYSAVEHLLLEQVSQMAPVSELRDVTNALRVIAERQEKAKSRLNPIVQSAPVINTIVQLNLPSHAIPEVVLNQEKEVIAIGNRQLAPLSSEGVVGLFKKLNTEGNAEGNTEHEPTSLPRSSEENAKQTLPSAYEPEKLSVAATKFLDSLHPAPTALQF